ncbi:YibE/F family protein [Clostridium felsineum]|uniref:YibE/F family protein n=1 Tax=Clostridium felsineum TaxID=36839 RepID=UPI0009D1082A|nr:YibE/F family protein [Clostridium felsineum]URZ16978.1 hypothetical protein CLFE_030300 [Clostridium felsineum DSM 794]
MKIKKNTVIILFFLSLLIAYVTYDFAANKPISGKVIGTTIGNSKKGVSKLNQHQLNVKITSGDHKGEVVTVDNIVNDKTFDEYMVEKNSNVLLNIEENENGTIKRVYIYEIVRYKALYILIFSFIFLLGVLAGEKGLKSILALLVTGFVILKVLIPLIVKGYNPIIVSIILCIAISTISLIVISGKNKKTLSAIIGTCSGLLIAAIIALVLSSKLKLTGFTDEQLQMLVYISQDKNFNFRGLLFSGILMGALGAVMDISMSIASSVSEIKEKKPDISTSALIKSAMKIGQDIMGTMANTLILAYVGGNLYNLILVFSYNLPLYRILDQDIIATEILNSLAGSLGLLFTVPITAVTAALLLNMNKENEL